MCIRSDKLHHETTRSKHTVRVRMFTMPLSNFCTWELALNAKKEQTVEYHICIIQLHVQCVFAQIKQHSIWYFKKKKVCVYMPPVHHSSLRTSQCQHDIMVLLQVAVGTISIQVSHKFYCNISHGEQVWNEHECDFI